MTAETTIQDTTAPSILEAIDCNCAWPNICPACLDTMEAQGFTVHRHQQRIQARMANPPRQAILTAENNKRTCWTAWAMTVDRQDRGDNDDGFSPV